MKDLNDRAAVGRACGNLGNTYYLLGNFKEAIQYHEEVNYYFYIIHFILYSNLIFYIYICRD